MRRPTKEIKEILQKEADAYAKFGVHSRHQRILDWIKHLEDRLVVIDRE